ncbi:MAG TPA: DUF2147 domain-containing protein [Xanthobacteraceae bacterium]|nr:DUF2147 domain-containing protein [Xanthobacteraceae bacterium]
MLPVLAGIGFLAPAFLATAAFAGPTDVTGEWTRSDGNARVRIAPCGSKVCATNVWIKDPSGGEAVGDRLVMTVSAKGDDTLAGTAYDAKRSLTYSMEMKVGPDKLHTRGCVLADMICRTVSWTRAN